MMLNKFSKYKCDYPECDDSSSVSIEIDGIFKYYCNEHGKIIGDEIFLKMKESFSN